MAISAPPGLASPALLLTASPPLAHHLREHEAAKSQGCRVLGVQDATPAQGNPALGKGLQ